MSQETCQIWSAMNDGKIHGLLTGLAHFCHANHGSFLFQQKAGVKRTLGVAAKVKRHGFLHRIGGEFMGFENVLNEKISKKANFDREAAKQARERVDQLIKPSGSLGVLEELVVQLAGIQATPYPQIHKKAVLVMAGDHDIIEEGVATSKKDITKIQAINMTRGVTGVCALAKQAVAEVWVHDVAIEGPVECEAIRHRKVRNSSGNFYKGVAMTREEAAQSLLVGIEAVEEAYKAGVNLIAVGEMGIGNTTPSSAIVSVITGSPSKLTTGIGANLPQDLVGHKAMIVEAAIDRLLPDPKDALDVLSKVGGCEIGAMAGAMMGGAIYGVPVVVDGFIAWAAALLAETYMPGTKDFLIASHKSMEAGAQIAAAHLGMRPYLDLSMRLGEGTGAVMMFSVIESAIAMNQYMITFEEAAFRVK